MTTGNEKRVGIKDIAEKAGVSIGTVDRVLHMRGEVSETTKTRVLEIIEQYGYTPNVIARTLSSKKEIRIGIVIPDSSDHNPYWEMPIQGITKAAAELNRYNTGIIYEFFDASDESSFREAFNKVSEQAPDGMIVNPVFGHNSLDQIHQLDEARIPYVSIEVNLEGIDKLGHFGQDAYQSGRVAASLVEAGVPGLSGMQEQEKEAEEGKAFKLPEKDELPEVLIIKQTSKKIFSKHIESRVSGFLEYFSDNLQKENRLQVHPEIVEIDLSQKGEPDKSLEAILAQHPEIKAVFIPNSRAFLVADFIDRKHLDGYFVVGYDIIDENIAHLEKGTIDFLIAQRPHEQAYNAIMALSEHLLTGKEIDPTHYSQIDIINKENIMYYKNK